LRSLQFHEADLRCRRLTGLPVKRASITIGRLLDAYLRSLSDDERPQEAALPPISGCTPIQLRESMPLLLKSRPAPPGAGRWAIDLLTELVPLLDWTLVLAHARFSRTRTGCDKVLL
jgi:hypothetical protein